MASFAMTNFSNGEANVKLMAKEAATLIHAIEKSCINKAEVVALDEREEAVVQL